MINFINSPHTSVPLPTFVKAFAFLNCIWNDSHACQLSAREAALDKQVSIFWDVVWVTTNLALTSYYCYYCYHCYYCYYCCMSDHKFGAYKLGFVSVALSEWEVWIEFHGQGQTGWYCAGESKTGMLSIWVQVLNWMESITYFQVRDMCLQFSPTTTKTKGVKDNIS